MNIVAVISAHEEQSTKMVATRKKKGHYLVQFIDDETIDQIIETDDLSVTELKKIITDHLKMGYKVVSISNTMTGRGRKPVGLSLDSTITVTREVE